MQFNNQRDFFFFSNNCFTTVVAWLYTRVCFNKNVSYPRLSRIKALSVFFRKYSGQNALFRFRRVTKKYALLGTSQTSSYHTQIGLFIYLFFISNHVVIHSFYLCGFYLRALRYVFCLKAN